jgi:hypothetical protein
MRSGQDGEFDQFNRGGERMQALVTGITGFDEVE